MSILDKKKLKHDYQYSSMPERIPLPVKHFAKKLFNPGKPVSGLSFRTTNWAQKMSKKYEQEIKRPGRKQIQSDTIRFSKPHSMTTYCTERLIQDYSKKKYYRFDDMMVILDPYKQSPLTALAIFYTKKPYRVRYTVMGKTSEADYTVTLEAKQEHRVPILGLYPAYRNKILMELLDDEGNAVKQRTITIGTKELPKGISNIVERKKYSAKPAYDMVMVSGGLHVCTFAFDCNADVRFYLRRKTKAYGIFPLSRGRFLYMEKWIDIPCYTVSQSCMMYEMDYSGRVYKTYFYKKGFHHCAREKEPGGNILLGSNSMEGYEENAVIELDRNTGEVVDYVRLNDYFGDRYNKTTDWVHINAVSYYPEDNSIIVSMRNLHTVVKIDWGSKELKWVLTHPETFKGMEVEDKVLKGVGDVKWFYQQHAAYQLRENLDGNPDTIHVIVYDNHWAKRVPVDWYDNDVEHSYLSIFTINEKEGTVSQHHITKVDNSRIRSNAILEYEKNRLFNMAGDLLPPVDESSGMVEEYDYESNKLLNRYYIKPGFFTAYPFEPDADAMSEPMDIDMDYFKGSTLSMEIYEGELKLDNPKKLKMVHNDEAEEILQDVVEDSDQSQDTEEIDTKMEIEIGLRFQEDVLLVKAMDHTISYIYLVGKNKTYYADLTGTYQTKDIFKDKVYEIPFWLKNLQKDVYHIYYDYKGEIYDSESEFTVLN